MPRLHLRTPASWAMALVPHRIELLVEQALLEKKAAAGALAFLFRYPEERAFLRPLSELAREELSHFELALEILERRGIAQRKLRPAPYAERLVALIRGEEPARLLDQLLVSAVIEARSAERLHLLAQAMVDVDAELAAFWAGLVASEARHQALYLELARARFGETETDARLTELLAHEAELLTRSAGLPRLHDGPPLSGAPCA